jgi:hypothetical protein
LTYPDLARTLEIVRVVERRIAVAASLIWGARHFFVPVVVGLAAKAVACRGAGSADSVIADIDLAGKVTALR